MATTKRKLRQGTARDEEKPVLRGVVNPASRVQPRRPISRPRLADPVTGNAIPPPPANPSQNPRGGF